MSRSTAADSVSANDRLKRGSPSVLWGSLIAATLLHLGVFALWPEMTAEVSSMDDRVITTLDVLEEIPLPAPPDPLPRPATPVLATSPVPDDVTIGLTTLEANPPEVLTPPPATTAGSEGRAVTFTPYTVRPEILNVDEVQREMARLYPPALRDAGIGGTVELALHIDEEGRVVEARVATGSGHRSLDAAALDLSDAFRFSPALNRDKRVAVWVAFPVVFRVRDHPMDHP